MKRAPRKRADPVPPADPVVQALRANLRDPDSAIPAVQEMLIGAFEGRFPQGLVREGVAGMKAILAAIEKVEIKRQLDEVRASQKAAEAALAEVRAHAATAPGAVTPTDTRRRGKASA